MSGELFDINTVCRMLGITSRTLRFYEEKHIISSTKVFGTQRRHYTSAQIDNIRNVLVLRSLGLTLKDIRDLQNDSGDLRSAIEINQAKIHALIAEKIRTLKLLNEALSVIESGGNIFDKTEGRIVLLDEKRQKVVIVCTEAIINNDTDILYDYLNEKIKSYMPKEVYQIIRKDTLKPLGNFVGLEKNELDPNDRNVILQYVKYEKLGLVIKYVFHGGKITGLWFNYYEM